MKKNKKKRAAGQPESRRKMVVYVGPSLGGEIMLTQNTVYRGDVSARVQEIITKYPEVGQMFVPIEKLSSTRQRLRDPKSGISGRYRALKKLTARR